MILPASSKKPHYSVRKTKNYLKETQMTLRNYIQISQKKGNKKGNLDIGVFSAKI